MFDMVIVFDDRVRVPREKPDHGSINQGLILSFDETLPTLLHF